jgi:hypothetical protein
VRFVPGYPEQNWSSPALVDSDPVTEAITLVRGRPSETLGLLQKRSAKTYGADVRSRQRLGSTSARQIWVVPEPFGVLVNEAAAAARKHQRSSSGYCLSNTVSAAV